MGIGFVLVVDKNRTDDTIRHLVDNGENPCILGEVRKVRGKTVKFSEGGYNENISVLASGNGSNLQAILMPQSPAVSGSPAYPGYQ